MLRELTWRFTWYYLVCFSSRRDSFPTEIIRWPQIMFETPFSVSICLCYYLSDDLDDEAATHYTECCQLLSADRILDPLTN